MVYVPGGTDASGYQTTTTEYQRTLLNSLSNPYLSAEARQGLLAQVQAATTASGGAAGAGAPGDGGPRGDAYALVMQMLEEYGLTSLASTVWGWIQQDMSPNEVALKIRDTPEFKQEYGGVMEERKKKGLPAVSVTEILGYRKRAAELFRAAGLPQGFHDDKSD